MSFAQVIHDWDLNRSSYFIFSTYLSYVFLCMVVCFPVQQRNQRVKKGRLNSHVEKIPSRL